MQAAKELIQHFLSKWKEGEMKGRIIITILIILGLGTQAWAGLDHVGTSVANFLKIGVGGRAVAMGDAYTAIAQGPTALYWNAGGLGFEKKMTVDFSYTNWIFGTSHSFLGVIVPFGDVGTVGLSITSFTSGDIEETTIFKPHGTGRVFSASDLSIGLSYARKLTDRYSFGITAKYLSEQLSLESANAVALDIGSIFIVSYKYNVRMGIVLSNFGSDMQMDGQDLQTSVSTDNSKQVEARLKTSPWPLPLIFKIGVAADLISTNQHRLTLAADVNDPRDYKARENLGMEYAFESMFFLRAGYKFNYDEDTFSAGAGFNYNLKGVGKVELDYSYSDMGRFNNISRFSIGISF